MAEQPSCISGVCVKMLILVAANTPSCLFVFFSRSLLFFLCPKATSCGSRFKSQKGSGVYLSGLAAREGGGLVELATWPGLVVMRGLAFRGLSLLCTLVR